MPEKLQDDLAPDTLVCWNPGLKWRRPEIVDGFEMFGFEGRYYMWPEEYELLAKYVSLSSGDYIEVGSMCGIIAVSLAEKHPERTFYCVDNFSAGHATIAGNKDIFLRNVALHEVQNVKLIEGDSQVVLGAVQHTFGIAFIDADHAYDHVMNDAINCWRLLEPGGVLVFHDYDCVPETTLAVDDFSRRFTAPIVEAVSGIAVLRKIPEFAKQDNPFDVRLRDLKLALGQKERDLQIKTQECSDLHEQIAKFESSAGWRILNHWRSLRDRLAPSGTTRRKFYDRLRSAL